jgi:hypothetical protein
MQSTERAGADVSTAPIPTSHTGVAGTFSADEQRERAENLAGFFAILAQWDAA